jgi:hypothetical protein
MSSASKPRRIALSCPAPNHRVTKGSQSVRISLDEIARNINFIEDMYLKLSIADCVEEIEKAAKFRQKKANIAESGNKPILKDYSTEIINEALMWLRQGHNICFYGYFCIFYI